MPLIRLGLFLTLVLIATSCRAYSDASPFNQRAEGAGVRPNSAAVVDRLFSFGPVQGIRVPQRTPDANDFHHPVYVSRGSDPAYTINCVRYCAPGIQGMSLRMPAAAQPAGGGDGHLAVGELHTGWEYDFWQARIEGRTITASSAGRVRADGLGLGGGATAADFGLVGGNVLGREIISSEPIEHALFVVVHCDNGTTTYPSDSSPGSKCADPTNAPPMGARFRLDMTDSEINGLAIPQWKKKIAHAAADYGLYVGDTCKCNRALSLIVESPASDNSFGRENGWQTLGRREGSSYNGSYLLDLGSGIPWRGRLRMIDPPRR